MTPVPAHAIISQELFFGTIFNHSQEVAMELRPWKEVIVGKGPRTPRGFVRAFKRNGIAPSKGLIETISCFDFQLAHIRRELQLVVLTPKMLGLKKNTSFRNFFHTVGKMGFVICPPVAGLYLRVQYKNQPPHEVLHVAIEALQQRRQGVNFLALSETFGKKWITSGFATKDSSVGENHRWVFALP